MNLWDDSDDAPPVHLLDASYVPLPRKHGTNESVTANFWPWLEPFVLAIYSPQNHSVCSPPRSTAMIKEGYHLRGARSSV